MLVLLHRIQIGIVPPCITAFFPRGTNTLFEYGFNGAVWHERQIQCQIEPGSTASFRRSLFGLVRVYNNLPANVVQVNTVSSFKWHLHNLMKTSASNNDPDWRPIANLSITYRILAKLLYRRLYHTLDYHQSED